MWKNDKKLKEILKAIAANPGISLQYGIAQKTGITQTTTSRKIINQGQLITRGFIRLEKGDRNANNCWLTYKGLLYAIQIGAVEAEHGRNVRKAHKIEWPRGKGPLKDLISLAEDMERESAKMFHSHITINAPESFNFDLHAPIAALLTFGWLLETNPAALSKYIKGKDLILSNGTILEDYKKGFAILKSIFEKGSQA